MKTILLTIIVIAAVHAALGQTPKEANPNDVSSLDSIMKSIYDVISGDATKPRDWDRFRSLFVPDGNLIPVRKDAKIGTFSVQKYTTNGYAERASGYFAKEGFFERETARRVEQYGHIAHVFSTYESRHALTDKTPFARGINSFQLFFDGKRWWVVNIFWDAETTDNPIPEKYLKTIN